MMYHQDDEEPQAEKRDKGWFMRHLPIWLNSVIERISILFAQHKPESSEIINSVLALGWILPLADNPNYLESSFYFRQFTRYLTHDQLLCLFFCLFVYWVICLLFGGEPSALIKSDGQLRGWTVARRIGMMMGAWVWFATSALFRIEGITIGYVIYGLLGFVWSTVVFLRIQILTRVQRDRMEQAKNDPLLRGGRAVLKAGG